MKTKDNNLMQKINSIPTSYRWFILLALAFAEFGNYFIYDIIPISAELLAEQLGFTDSQIGGLQFWYSAVNIVMVLIGGIIIDKIGTRKSLMIFTTIFVAGAGITALKGDFLTMTIGRLIFGLGAETMIVAVSVAVARWFKNSTLSLAMGIQLTVARLGSFTAENSPSWGASLFDDWQKPLILAAFVGIFSIIMVGIYYFLDKNGEKKFDLPTSEKQEEINFKNFFNFDKSFWYISILCLVFYSAIFPFKTFAPRFFIAEHGIDLQTAGVLTSIITFSAMILTPIFGGFVDKFGRRASIMVFGCILIMPVYLIMAYTHSPVSLYIPIFGVSASISLVIPMILMGISFSLIPSAMWPSVPIIVNEDKTGTAFGLMTMLQNVGLMSLNFIVGRTNDATGNYTAGMWIFTTLGFIGLIFAILLIIRERSPHKHGIEEGRK
jgi:MFS family permease